MLIKKQEQVNQKVNFNYKSTIYSLSKDSNCIRHTGYLAGELQVVQQFSNCVRV